MKSSYSQVLQQMEQLNDNLNQVRLLLSACSIPHCVLYVGAIDDITATIRTEGKSS